MARARCNLVIQDEAGNIVDGASVEVRDEATALLPQLYSNRAGTIAIGNPFTATDGADAGFHVVGGAYKITATKATFTRIWRFVPIGTNAEVDVGILAEFSITISGIAPTAGEIIEGHVFTRQMTFPAGLALSKATSRVAATASSVFAILKNGSSVGTVTFAIASSVGVFAMASDLSAAAGDQVDIQCPNPADATIRGIKITLRGAP